MKNCELKKIAVEMRKNGDTFLEISKKININKSTVGKWVNHIKLSKEQISNKLRNIKLLESEQKYKKIFIDKNIIENSLLNNGFYVTLKKLKLTSGCLKYWCKQHDINLAPFTKERKKYTHCEICKTEYEQFQKKKPKICCACECRIRRLTNKIRSIEYMGGKCSKCGYKCSKTNYAAFEFHHPNKDKEMNIGQNLNRKWGSIKLELTKCKMLCSNCHRIEHSDYTKSNTISMIRKKCLDYIDKIKNDINAKLNLLDENNLKDMTKTLSLKKISKKTNIPMNSIYSFCKLKNISVPRKCHKKFEISKEDLGKLVVCNPMTKIGKMLGVSDTAIRKRCLSLGIDYKAISPTANCKKTTIAITS